MQTRSVILLFVSWTITAVALALAAAAMYLNLSTPAATLAAEGGSSETAASEPTPAPLPALSPTAPLPAADLTGDGVSMADVVARVIPSVVNVSSRHGGARVDLGPMGGPPDHGAGDSLGSGVIVSEDGLVVTNNHVVEGATEITIHLSDGRELACDVVGTDAPSDVALLRVRGDDVHLPPLPYGDSTALRQGDVVVAIGNPFGVGQTVTMGIVSAVGRADMGIAEYEDFIQTDASINPGNSGGALISMRGELVGINTAILSRTGGSHGIGFAIPSNMVRPIVEALLRDGKVTRGWLGVTIQDVDDMDPALVSAMHLPASQGVLVTDIETGSPAEDAGVVRGDFIEALDGEVLTSTAQLRNVVATRGAEAAITLTIVRSGERRTLAVTLGERPNRAGPTSPPFGGGGGGGGGLGGGPMPGIPGVPGMPPGMGVPSLPGLPGGPPGGAVPRGRTPSAPSDLTTTDVGGLAVADLDTRARAIFGIPASIAHGAIVAMVSPGTPGEATGIMPGDVVVEVNREPVAGAAELAAAYRSAGGSAVLLVRRGGGSLYVLMR